MRLYLGRDRHTRRRRYHNRTIRGGLTAAQRYLNARLREREQGRDLEGAEISLNEYLEMWLEMAARPKLRAKSYTDYESLLRRYLRPELGERSLRTLTPLAVQAVYHQMHVRGLSSRTIRYTHAVLHAALEQAVRWKMLSTNPSIGVELPRVVRRAIQVLSPEEVRRFLQYAFATPYGLVLAFAVTSGLRPSEYLALQWGDIDWQRGTVKVTRTLEKGSGGGFAGTKRHGSRRIVRLQAWIVERLRAFHGEPSRPSSELIFVQASGRPLNSDYLGRQLQATLGRAGLPKLRLYDLRHTAATLALAAGVSAKVVSEQLGHATSAFTLDVYSHVLPHLQEEAAQRVEALLDPLGIRSPQVPRKPNQPVLPWNRREEIG